MTKKMGFPKETLVINNQYNHEVTLYNFNTRNVLKLNRDAFLILDAVNSIGDIDITTGETIPLSMKYKIYKTIDMAISKGWICEVKDQTKCYIKTIKTNPSLTLIQWEMTNQCNLKCVHCYNNSGRHNQTPELSTIEVKQIIDQADSMGVWQMDLTGGELFMRNDIIEILEYLRDKHIAVRIASNGTLLTDDIIQKLKQLKIRAYATSIDGGSAKSNDIFRGVPGSFEKAYLNLKKIKGAGIPIRRVNVTATTLNENEMNQIQEMYRELGVPYVVDNIVPSGRGEDSIKYNVENEKLVKFKLQAYFTNNSVIHEKALYNAIGKTLEKSCPSCGIFTNRLFIMSEGEYTFCPTLSGRENSIFRLGKSKDITLNEAWENAQKVVNKIGNVNCREISKCRFAKICKGGCRSRAYISTGKFDAPDIVMCKYANYLEKELKYRQDRIDEKVQN